MVNDNKFNRLKFILSNKNGIDKIFIENRNEMVIIRGGSISIEIQIQRINIFIHI